MASMQQFHQPYVLPSFKDAVPESWRSNSAPKPPASSLQTVVVSSLSASQSAGGHTDISVPLGPASGIMSQAYLKFNVAVTATNADTIRFKGSQHSALALINRYTTSVNGIALDTIANFDQSAGDLLNHCTSNDWIKNDSAVLMGSNVVFTASATGGIGGGAGFTETFCIPLFGFLSGTIPSYLLNGQLNIGIDYNSVARAFNTVTGTGPTAFSISSVQLIYDRISPSQEFIDMVKSELRSGQKFVIPYVNIQNVNLVSQNGSNNLSVGVNYSSLRSVLLSQVVSADYTTLANEGLSVNAGMSQFQVSCDGRLLSAVTYDTVNNPALCFLEAQKACGRAFDTSISDPCAYLTAVNTASTTQVRSYLTNNFFAGCSGLRVNEQLAFAGTPVSVLTVNWTVTSAPTANITLLADMQALIDDQGNVTIYR
jgi:hypothetical protein